jgi:hypothetical protein
VPVAIVDTGGTLVHYEKMDNRQTGSANVRKQAQRRSSSGRRERCKRYWQVGEMGCGF